MTAAENIPERRGPDRRRMTRSGRRAHDPQPWSRRRTVIFSYGLWVATRAVFSALRRIWPRRAA